MKKYAFFLFACTFLLSCQSSRIGSKQAPATVEASCGQCKFGMEGASCDLAIRLDGKSYFVTGTGIDDHGDAHAEDGFCESIREAKVVGKLKKGRFHARQFELTGSR